MNIESDLDGSTATHVEVNAGLNLTVYAAKEHAKKAQEEAGGIVLEVDATCLADVEGKFGKTVLLTSDAPMEGITPSSAYIDVCYSGLPFEWVLNYGQHDPGMVEPQGEIARFGPEAQAWLNALEKETGFEYEQ